MVGKRLHKQRSEAVSQSQHASLPTEYQSLPMQDSYVSQQGLGCDGLVLPPLSCLVRDGGIACISDPVVSCTPRSMIRRPVGTLGNSGTYQLLCRWKSEVKKTTIYPAIASPGACRARAVTCNSKAK